MCESNQGAREPHVIRHTTAMRLLHSGVDIAVVALWLGHESIETTHGYIKADINYEGDFPVTDPSL
jgi:integrase/recombinase XerD